jgi:hypothetical protein
MATATEFQDVRIREVPVPLARRFKSALAARGITVAEWFLIEAARTAEEHERSVKVRRG